MLQSHFLLEMVLVHKPLGRGVILELVTMTRENVSPGPPPEGYMEGQACVCV